MVGPIVLAASAGLGMLAGLAAADRCSSSGAGTNNLPLAGGARWPSCAACGGTGEVACLCARWSDGDVGCRPCSGSGRTACRRCRGSGRSGGRRVPVRVAAVRAQGPLVAVNKSQSNEANLDTNSQLALTTEPGFGDMGSIDNSCAVVLQHHSQAGVPCKAARSLTLLIISEISKERNTRVFRRQEKPVASIMALIKSEAATWITPRAKDLENLILRE
ncbi:hypothetical protein HU200_026980 [Digitaria exilis]|uniref:Uncharacterized protein n=1 Tax=Digitaria exilis TaxID=1010633 RepID=A0A835BXL0_9POAL|nr:hypothetical protein HU200_026980 [Digitaria exilis]